MNSMLNILPSGNYVRYGLRGKSGKTFHGRQGRGRLALDALVLPGFPTVVLDHRPDLPVRAHVPGQCPQSPE